MAIVSFKHNFVFIKTTKTAGTSIEVDLSERLEDEAIVTRIGAPSAPHRARNFETSEGTFFNHMSGAQIREIIGRPKYDRMFKFCVEREPVEKCISHFHMLRNSPLHSQNGAYTLSWNDYCLSRNFPIDIDKYSEVQDGQRLPLVDQILRYETLGEDLPRLLRQLGIDNFVLSAREKSTFRNNRLVSHQEVTREQKEAIASAFAESSAFNQLYPVELETA